MTAICTWAARTLIEPRKDVYYPQTVHTQILIYDQMLNKGKIKQIALDFCLYLTNSGARIIHSAD